MGTVDVFFNGLSDALEPLKFLATLVLAAFAGELPAGAWLADLLAGDLVTGDLVVEDLPAEAFADEDFVAAALGGAALVFADPAELLPEVFDLAEALTDDFLVAVDLAETGFTLAEVAADLVLVLVGVAGALPLAEAVPCLEAAFLVVFLAEPLALAAVDDLLARLPADRPAALLAPLAVPFLELPAREELGLTVFTGRFLGLKALHPVNLGGLAAGMVCKSAKCVKLTLVNFRRKAMASQALPPI